MKPRLETKYEAIKLRKEGKTYREIMDILPVSKSNLSNWLKYVSYTQEEILAIENKIKQNSISGRLRASFTNRKRRISREDIAYKKAEKIFEKYKENQLFTIGIALYWAEGSKRTGQFQFINSDPEMIKFMIFWLQKFMDGEKEEIKCRLYMHKIYSYENCEEHWAGIIGINAINFQSTTYKKNTHRVKKNPNYKGCLRISFGRIEELRMMKAFQKLLIGYYSGIMHP